MKSKIFSVVTLIIISIAVGINTIYIANTTNRLVNQLDEITTDAETALEAAEELQQKFLKEINYISLTVSHNDLTNIENEISEFVGCLKVGDTSEAEVVKNRLRSSLNHLKRLSGINIDSII